MSKDQWEIKNTPEHNRFLKVRNSFNDDEYDDYKILVVITHKYNTNDDILFPMPQTLAFINGFEEYILDDNKLFAYIASDMNNGVVNLYGYVKDHNVAIHHCIEYFKNIQIIK